MSVRGLNSPVDVIILPVQRPPGELVFFFFLNLLLLFYICILTSVARSKSCSDTVR